MRVVFMGTPEFAVTLLEHLIADGHHVVAAYTQPDRAAGRGRASVASPVKKAALALDVPVMQPVSLRGDAVAAQLATDRPDAIVVAAYGLLLPQSVLDLPTFGCVNIHPSLLPKCRGVSPVPAAILAGDTFTGVSLIQMDRGLDTGPVFARAQIPISDADTAQSLTAKLSLIGAQMLLDVLTRLAQNELASEPQGEAEASYCGPITKADGQIDWGLPAVDIWRRVRAYWPWPGSYTRWRGHLLKIVEAVPLARDEIGMDGTGDAVGTVIALERAGAAFGVVAGEGVLGVKRVQPEGRRAMSAADFVRGQRHGMGMVLPSD